MSFSDFEVEKLKHMLDPYDTYEEYLNFFISPKDINYLGNMDIARQLIELSLNIKTQILSKNDFYEKKNLLNEATKSRFESKIIKLSFKNVDENIYKEEPFLLEISKREEDILNGKLMTIIYLRSVVRNSKKKYIEISAYIDLCQRFKNEKFEKYYERKKVILPKQSDLSYYNWNTGICFSNDSENFKIDSNIEKKELIFKTKRDRKKISVDINSKDPNIMKKKILSNIKQYKQIVFFDLHLNKNIPCQFD